MRSKRQYIDYLKDILSYSHKIEKFTQGIDFNQFLADEEKMLAVVHALQIIGEAAKHLPRSLTKKYPEISWVDIVGMRNFIVHGYFIVDAEIVWKTVQQDVPLLCHVTEKMLEANQQNGD